jgi:hypothetical protein
MSDEIAKEFTESLAHYGVPGMKWGKRRNSSGRSVGKASAKKRVESKDAKSVKKLRKKKVSELNNDDIKKLTARLELEKKHKDLNPSVISRGNKQVLSVLALGATLNGVIRFAQSPAGQKIAEAMKRAGEAAASAGASQAARDAGEYTASRLASKALGR